MRSRLLALAAAFAVALGLVSCAGNDDDEITTDEVRGELQQSIDSLRDSTKDLAGDIDARLHETDLSELDDSVRQEWNAHCRRLSETAEDEDIGTELTDVCGDLRAGLEGNDRNALEEARDRLRDLADDIEDGIDDMGGTG